MADVAGEESAGEAARRSPALERFPGGHLGAAVAAIVLLGLLARLVGLGGRIAHQDEARVGYWTLRYLRTGAFEYRPIIHGPFLPIVTRWVFELFGASDTTARLPVALVGSALPASAWLFREHLEDREVVALALLFAAGPVLLYYSRFMRSDVLAAAFAVFALGLFVRTYDTGRPRYLFGAAAMLALALTTKENAVLYPVTWLGAGALLLDQRLFVADLRERDPVTIGYDYAARILRAAWRWRWPIAIASVEFLAVFVFFYAPRGGGFPVVGTERPIGLWWSLERLAAGDPDMFVAVLEEATVGTVEKATDQWLETDRPEGYLYYFRHYVQTLRAGALATVGLAAVGFLADRYSLGPPRDLVALGAYWGVASVMGYPLATDIRAPWATVHAVVGLAFPAAVGVGLLYRWGSEALVDDDPVGVALAVLLLLGVTLQVTAAAYGGVYANPSGNGNQLVQYAQSSSPELKPTVTDSLQEVAAENRGVDVLFYGDRFHVRAGVDPGAPPIAGGTFERLPLSWYTEVFQYRLRDGTGELNVSSTLSAEAVTATNASRLPPVVVTFAHLEADRPGWSEDAVRDWNRDHATEADIADALGDNYDRYEFQRYRCCNPIVVYVRQDWRADAAVEKWVPPTGPPGDDPPTVDPTTNRTLPNVTIPNGSTPVGPRLTEATEDRRRATNPAAFDGLNQPRAEVRGQ